jgi:Ca2+-binding EF-hand superfamily protein
MRRTFTAGERGPRDHLPEPPEKAALPASRRRSTPAQIVTDEPVPAAGEEPMPTRKASLTASQGLARPAWPPETPCASTKAGKKSESNFDKWVCKVRASIAVQKIQEVSKDVDKAERKKREEPQALFTKSTKSTKKKRIISDLTEVRRIFDSFDQDQSGYIEPHEFLPLLAKLLRHPQSEIDKTEVWRNWDAVDQDGSGQISYDEFQRWYCEKFGIIEMPDFRSYFSDDIVTDDQKQIRMVAKNIGVDALLIERIWHDFKSLDNDDSGRLEFDEFKRLVQRQLAPSTDSPEVPHKVIEKFWMDIDADGSGNVNFEEFATWYLKFFVGDISPMEHYYQLLGSGYRRKTLQSEDT